MGNKLKQNQIAGAIIIAGLIIAGAILLKDKSSSSNADTALQKVKIEQVSDQEHILGNKNAKIMIVEYSDTECPWCKVFHSTMQKVVSENSNVAWVYRHYPISELHSKSEHEAIATECAWEQGGNDMFWKYINEVFARTESNNKLETTELSKIANDLGLNMESFENCLSSEKYKEKISTYKTGASSLEKQLVEKGIIQNGLGTPSSFIVKKGKIVEMMHGAESYESIMQKIEKLR
ncbi:MAG TPA: thioredoxin domain-containing protein [Candidatus Paceibacterota bacterium]|nr:thioredoxin domain-containing protein [Candidatus Paceibacterota bacterium]HPT17938.1 thioredoxin domain-containing protein [Candidatus Paceibacterota bacterium]